MVLLGATALGRARFGVLLVLAYGAAMALTLTLAGLLLLRAQTATASVIGEVGVLLVARGLALTATLA